MLLLKNGVLVRSRNFSFHQSTGDPIGQVERFTAWKADELVYLDISRDGMHHSESNLNIVGSGSSKKFVLGHEATSFIDVIRCVSLKCMIPLTAGGKISSIQDISLLLQNGADKVSINTYAIENPSFVESAANKFGSQCIVISVDVKLNPISGKKEVYKNFGKEFTGLDPAEWCKILENLGAGEILLNSVDRDGTGLGYDLELVKTISDSVKIPVIALGGVGNFKHFVEGLNEGGATAVAAANIFHFTELSIINAKKYLQSHGVDVRL